MTIMKLQHWISIKRISQTLVARLGGTSASSINRHILHGRTLDHEVMRRMYFLSQGAVQPNDFFDLENCPPDLQEIFYGPKARKRKVPTPTKARARRADSLIPDSLISESSPVGDSRARGTEGA